MTSRSFPFLRSGDGSGSDRNAGGWLIALLVFGVAGVLAFYLPPALFAAMLAAGVIVLVWLVAPEAVVVTLLLARSSVDGIMELFTLFAGSPLAMNLSGATNSLAVGLGVLTLVRRLVRRRPLFVSAPGWTYALYLLFCLFSLPSSVDMVAGVKEWARLASGLAIFLMVADVVGRERRAPQRFVVVIMVSSLIPLTLGWLQVLTGTGYFFLGFVGTQFAYRPQGTFAHPGGLGAYLVVLLTLSAAIFFSTPSKKVRASILVWACVAAGCLVLTMARTNWLGIMIAALTLGMLKRRRIALLSLVAAAALFAAVPLLRERLMSSDSVLWRLDLWQAGVQLAWPPTLLGRGLASSPLLVNQLLPKVISPPHNDYLKALIETGVFGLMVYGAWLVMLLRHAWRAYRCAAERAVAWRGLGLLASVAAIIVMSLTDNVLGHTAVQWYLWALIALVPVAVCVPEKNQGDQ